MKQTNCLFLIVLMLLLFFFNIPLLSAKSLNILLPELINKHERILAAEERRNTALHLLRQTKGARYPKLDLFLDGGREWVDTVDGVETTETRNYQHLRGTQLITDFGLTDSAVQQALFVLERSKAELETARQQITLEGITAFLAIVKARDKLKYARQSEDNITRQTGIEEELVKRGAGVSSDVLQTKSQLAGAKALRVSVEGELFIAKNRFNALFKRFPSDDEINAFVTPGESYPKFPGSLEESLETAGANNPLIHGAEYSIEMYSEGVRMSKSKYYPSVNLFAEAKRREDYNGISGIREEALGGIEFSYNLFNGGSDNAAIKAARARLSESKNVLEENKNFVEEQVRNAWQNLHTSREHYRLLQNQSNIVGEFLELARKERKLGNRSLQDILTGEVNYINSVSNAVSAEIDTIIATYNLYYAMGKLTLELF